jgi:hypothetical protein
MLGVGAVTIHEIYRFRVAESDRLFSVLSRNAPYSGTKGLQRPDIHSQKPNGSIITAPAMVPTHERE